MRWKLLDKGPPATHVVVLDSGDEAVGALGKFVQQQRIEAASLSAIGAFERAVVGYFDWAKKDYKRISVEEQVEVLSLLGDVAVSEGKPTLHIHAVLGRLRRQRRRRPPARRPCAADARSRLCRAAGASQKVQGPGNRSRADRIRQELSHAGRDSRQRGWICAAIGLAAGAAVALLTSRRSLPA
jgi:hypothetical protein